MASLFGWLFETSSFAILWTPDDRGFLTLPFCYLYGTVTLAVYFLLGTPFQGRIADFCARITAGSRSLPRTVFKYVLRFSLYFISVTLLATLAEFTVGLIFIKWADVPLWYYGNFDRTFMDIVCFDFSLLWGVLITVGMCTLWRLFVWIADSMTESVRTVTAVTLITAVSVDFIFNCVYFISTGVHFNII